MTQGERDFRGITEQEDFLDKKEIMDLQETKVSLDLKDHRGVLGLDLMEPEDHLDQKGMLVKNRII